MQTIYLLRDPITLAPRYVGVTSRSMNIRMRQRRSDVRRGVRSPELDWQRGLLAQGREPIVEILEICENRQREAWWIQAFRLSHPNDLLNLAPGGDAPGSCHPDVAAKIAASRRASRWRGENVLTSKLTDDEVLEIRRRYAAGHLLTEIASSFRIDPTTAGNVATGKTWAHLPGAVSVRRGKGWNSRNGYVQRGEAKPDAKLTPGAVMDIRRRRLAGEMVKDIAKAFGVSPGVAGRVASGKAWKHLPMPPAGTTK